MQGGIDKQRKLGDGPVACAATIAANIQEFVCEFIYIMRERSG